MKVQRIRFASCVAVIGTLLTVAEVRAAQWLISGPANTLTDFTESGAAANLRSISPIFGVVAGIDYSADGVLYALTTKSDDSLYTINPTTGVSTLVGPTGLSEIREGDLGFDPTSGTLYGLYNLGSGGPEFFTLNTTTGAATIIGTIAAEDLSDLSGLAFDNSGQMWVLDTNVNTTRVPTLLKVDKTDGNILSTQSTGLSAGLFLDATLGADFNPTTNQLYFVWGGNFYRENITTGLATLIGPHEAGYATGLAFVGVPEPGSLPLFVVGMSGIAALYCRRR
jgi:hypothetical protein